MTSVRLKARCASSGNCCNGEDSTSRRRSATAATHRRGAGWSSASSEENSPTMYCWVTGGPDVGRVKPTPASRRRQRVGRDSLALATRGQLTTSPRLWRRSAPRAVSGPASASIPGTAALRSMAWCARRKRRSSMLVVARSASAALTPRSRPSRSRAARPSRRYPSRRASLRRHRHRNDTLRRSSCAGDAPETAK